MRCRNRLILLGTIAAILLAVAAGSASASVGTITIDPKGTLSAHGTQATVSGTINCFSGDLVQLFANVTETVGRVQRYARGFTDVFCTGAVQPWSVPMTALSTTLSLVPGPANVGAFAFDESDFTQTSTMGSVLLVP